MAQQQAVAEAFMRLVSIMDDLREKCPWDKKQTDANPAATDHRRIV